MPAVSAAELEVLDRLTVQGSTVSPFGGLGLFQNLLLNSEDFSGAGWAWYATAGTVTTNDQTAPDGTSSADTITIPAGAGRVQSYNTTVGSATNFTFSVWLKSAGSVAATLTVRDDVGGAPGGTASKDVTVGTTWERFFVAGSLTTASAIGTHLRNNGGGSITVYAWGAQLEQAGAPGVYVKTISATVSPSALSRGLVSNSDLLVAGSQTITGGQTVSGDQAITGNLDVTGSAQFGSGNVNLIDSTGKLAGLSATTVADLSGANLTSLNATNIASGTLAAARLPADGYAATYVNEGQASSITSAMITDGQITDADVSATAGIVDTKLATISTAGKVADSALPAGITRDTEWDTTAKINTATTDDDFATLTGSQTLTNKTLGATTMTGHLTFSDAQKLIGGTATTADLTLQTTTGVGAAGADMHFLVGNNGATEALTILNSGNVGIGTTSPSQKLDVLGTAKAYDLIAHDVAFSGGFATTVKGVAGYAGYTNVSGGVGTGGADSIVGGTRLTQTGNLVNIGSIQAGETLLTKAGTFAAKADYTIGSSSKAIAIGDLNGDGKADIVAGNGGSATISVLLNNGNGTLASHVTYATGGGAKTLAVGDVNGDGKADVVVVRNSNVSVFINTGNGTLAAKVDYAADANAGNGSNNAIALGDLTGDGKADLAVANGFSNSFSVFVNTGNGTFAARVDYPVSAFETSSIAMGDLNGDGKADLAVANYWEDAEVFINTGDGTFGAPTILTTGSNPLSVAIGDLNGDGKGDVAVGHVVSAFVSVYLNNGGGTFAAPVNYTKNSAVYGLALGDLTGDGKADLAAVNTGSTNVSVFLNNGDGTFAAKVDYATNANPHGVVIGDLTGDGKADLAVVNDSGGAGSTVSVFINQTTPILSAKAGSGNVGIGTATPAALLDVQGAAQFGSGNVNLIDATGKIAGISSTYFASLDGSTLTGLTAANITNGTFTDAQVSDTLTASNLVGAGSTTNAVDLATAEVAGILPDANVADTLTIGASSTVADGALPAGITRDTEWDTTAKINTATTDDDFATLTGGQTLTNKTLGSTTMQNDATLGQAAGPLVAFDDTNNYLEITGANVGIGTTAPAQKLDVTGSIQAVGDGGGIAHKPDTTSGNYINVQSFSTGTARIVMNDAVASRRFDVFTGGNVYPGGPFGGKFGIVDATANIVRLTLDATGNLGIGTTSPVSKLDVAGSLRTTGPLIGDVARGPFTTAGMISYWPMDEGSGAAVSDLSVNTGSNTGTIDGATWVNGVYGKALQFVAANNQEVAVTNNSTLEPTAALTLMAWVKPSTDSQFSRVVGKGRDVEANNYGLWLGSGFSCGTNGTSRVMFRMTDQANASYSAETCNYLVSTQWYHLVGVWDGSTMKIYVNGVLGSQGTESVAAALTRQPNAKNLYIGAHVDVAQFGFDGAIDEVRLYNRALSAEEIQAHYQALVWTRRGNDALLLPSGNVGLGTTTPATKLDVAGTARATKLELDGATHYIDTSGDNMVFKDVANAGEVTLTDLASGVAGAAPKTAAYLVTSADGTLTNEVVTGSLGANLALKGDAVAARTITLGQQVANADIVNFDVPAANVRIGGSQLSTTHLSDGANVAHINAVETLSADWVNTANPWADNEVSDTLTASLVVGSGSTTTAVDLATAEVAGVLPDANVANTLTASALTVTDGGTVGQAAGPLLTFDDTANELEISGGNVGIGTTSAAQKLDVSGNIRASGSVATGGAAPSGNLLVIGAEDGVNEGGQLSLVSSNAGSYNSAWIDLYQDQLRFASGTPASGNRVLRWVGAGPTLELVGAGPGLGATLSGFKTISSSDNTITLDAGAANAVTLGASDSLTVPGNVAVNGGGLTSTGALTITPGAGTNLNVALSTTGDFAVNTSQLYVDTSTARVGIGTTSPGAALEVNGNLFFTKQAARTIQIADSTAADTNAPTLTIQGAAGGAGGAGSSAGGHINITGGTGASNAPGGNIVLTGGASGAGTGFAGGDVTIQAGLPGGAGPGGNIVIGGGAPQRQGGSVTIQAQTSGNNGGQSLAGGALTMTSGNGNEAGAGGTVSLTAGTGGATGAGGALIVATGAGGATSGNSGDLTLRTGAVTSGVAGAVIFQTGGATERMRLTGAGHVELTGTLASPFGGIGRYENALVQSEAFATTWTNSGLTITDGQAAPDSGTAADKLANSAAAAGYVEQAVTPSGNSTDYVFSVWLKAGDVTGAELKLTPNGTGPVVGTSALTLTTAWQRYSIKATTGSSGTTTLTARLTNTSAVSAKYIYAWGAQVEQASAPGVYAKTTTTAIAAAKGLVSSGDLLVAGSQTVTGGQTVSGNQTITGTLAVNDTTAGALDVAGGAQFGSGNVALITTAGKLAGLSGTYLANLDGSALTGLTAANVTGSLTDAQVSDTLTASSLVGSGSTTTAVDLATAEVAGVLPDANVANTLTASALTVTDGGTVGQAAGPLLTFDDTANELEISGGNVGIGTTSPDRKLDVNGVIEIASGNNLIIETPDQTSGSQDAALSATQLLFYNTAAGTTAPKSSVYFNANRAASGYTPTAYARIQGGKENTTGDGSEGVLIFETTKTGDYNTFYERMRIDSSGRVGIGTTTVNEKLEVNGNIRLTPTGAAELNLGPATWTDASTARKWIHPNDKQMAIFMGDLQHANLPNSPKDVVGVSLFDGSAGRYFTVAGTSDAGVTLTPRFWVEGSSGNVYAQGSVGIGTTNPLSSLDVYNGNVRANALVASNGAGQNIAGYNGTTWNFGPAGNLGSALVFQLNGEKARLSSIGNLGLGTTTPQTQLELTGSLASPFGGVGRYENLFVQSEALNTTWTATGATVTANPAAANPAPEGSDGVADEVDFGAVAANRVTQPISLGATTDYAVSFWAKAAAGTPKVRVVRAEDGATNIFSADLTLSTSWQRYSVSFATGAVSGSPYVGLANGSTGTNDNIYVWGLQLEAAATPGVYAKTTTTAIAAAKGLVSSGDLLVAGSQTITGGQTVSGNQTITGTLAVNDTTAGALDVAGGAQFGSGNVALITTAGKLAGLSGTYVADLNGSALTNLNADNIATGTLNSSRLPADGYAATYVNEGQAGSVTSAMVTDGELVDADINANAAIVGTKISPNFGNQDVSVNTNKFNITAASGNTAVAGTMDVAGHGAFGGAGTVMSNFAVDLSETSTATTGATIPEYPGTFLGGLHLGFVANPASAPSLSSYVGASVTADTASGNANAFATQLYGVGVQARHIGTNTISTVTALEGSAQNNSTGTITTAQGTIGRIANWSTGTITNAYGFYTYNWANQGTINNYHGIYVTNSNGSVLDGGTIGTNYGLYVANQTKGTNDYGIYVGGADTTALWVDSGTSRLDGNTYLAVDSGSVGIGTTSPAALLDVQGAAQFGSGNVNLIDATGKLAGISSTYFASLDGSALTGLTAANVTGSLTDAQVSDTLTASALVGSGSTTTAVDLATAEVAGVLPDANVADTLTIGASSTVADGALPAGVTRDTEWDTAAKINTATTDDDFATLTGAQTLTNKTLGATTLTGDLTFSDAQKLIGGTATTADLTLQTTTGVGAAGADMHFLVGNNGATEALTILNSGNVGIGTTNPSYLLALGNAADRTVGIENSAGSTAGRALTIRAGAGGSTGPANGGALTLRAGDAKATSYGAGNASAGNITLTAGGGTADTNGLVTQGSFTFNMAAAGSSEVQGGSFAFTAGSSVGSDRNGGAFTFTGGTGAAASGIGGGFTVNAGGGGATASSGVTPGTGGGISLAAGWGGTNSGAGAALGGTGGAITLTSGGGGVATQGGSTGGTSGAINLITSAGGANNGGSGSILLRTGAPNGTGVAGAIIFQTNGATERMRLSGANLGLGTTTPQTQLELTGVLASPYGGLGTYENALVQSEAFGTTWTNSGLTITDGQATPDGSLTADKLANSAAASGYVEQAVTPSGASTDYVFSVWLKAGDVTGAELKLTPNGTGPVVGTSAVTLTTTWQRYSIKATTGSSGTTTLTARLTNTSAVSAKYIYAWGAQVEQASAPGVYAKTTTTAIAAAKGLVSSGDLLVAGSQTVTGGQTVSGSQTITSDLAVNGDATLGDTNADTVTINAGPVNLPNATTAADALVLGGDANLYRSAANTLKTDDTLHAAGGIILPAGVPIYQDNTAVKLLDGTSGVPRIFGTGTGANTLVQFVDRDGAGTVRSIMRGADGALGVGVGAIGSIPATALLQVGGSVLTALANGAVGLGTTNPALDLHLSSGSGSAEANRNFGILIDSTGSTNAGTEHSYIQFSTPTYKDAAATEGLEIGMSETGVAYISRTQNDGANSNGIALNGSGSVGIGTTSPGALFDVQGAAQFGSGNVNLIDAAGKITAINSTYFASLDGSALTGLTAANVTGSLTDAQVSDTLTASALVGSGSTTTAVDLATAEVAGVLPDANVANTLTSSALTVTDGGTVGQAAGPLLTFDDTANELEISGGNVGIGTTAPAAKLQITGVPTATHGTFKLVTDTSGGTLDPVFVFNNGAANVVEINKWGNVSIGGAYSGEGGAASRLLEVEGSMSGGFGVTGYGIYADLTAAPGTGNSIYGIYSIARANAAGGVTIPLLASIYAASPAKPGGNTVTDAANLYIPTAGSVGTSNYALYSAGGTNYFGGNVGIGTTGPGAKLQVNTDETTDGLILRDTVQNANARFHFTAPLGSSPDLNITTGGRLIFNTWLRLPGAPFEIGTSGSYLQVGTGGGMNFFGNYGAQFAFGDTAFTGGTLNIKPRGNVGGQDLTVLKIQSLYGTNGNPTAVIKAAAGQTAPLTQWQNSAGASLTVVDAAGNLGLGTTTPQTQLELTGVLASPYGGLGRYQNLMLQSEAFSTSWTATNLTLTDGKTGPEGGTSADELKITAGGSTGNVAQTVTISAAAAADYTFSVWLKASSVTGAQLDLDLNGTGVVDTTSGAVTLTTTWQRYSLKATTVSDTTSLIAKLTNTSTTANATIEAWGAQLEKAATPGVYAKTTTTAIAAAKGLVSSGDLLVAGSQTITGGQTVSGSQTITSDLAVNGDTTLGDTNADTVTINAGPVNLPNATAAADALVLGGDANLYRSSANVLKTDDALQSGNGLYAGVNSANYLRLEGASAGNMVEILAQGSDSDIGIKISQKGTTATYISRSLHVQNAAYTGNAVRLDGANAGGGVPSLGTANAGADVNVALDVLTKGSGELRFQRSAGTGGVGFYGGDTTADVFVTSGGSVGIGTTNPTMKLDIRGANAQGWGEGKGLVYLGGDTTTSDSSGLMMNINVLTSPNLPGIGLRARNRPNPGDGQTSPAWYQVYIDDGGKIGTGTITNAYGLYVNTPTVATNNYAAYFAGNVGIGTTAPIGELHVASTTTVNATRGLTSSQHNDGVQGAASTFRKSRGTPGSPTTVASGDYLGFSQYQPYVSTSGYMSTSAFGARVNGTVTGTAAPTEFFVSTNSTNDVDPFANGTVRLLINAAGSVGIGTTSPGALLDVQGAAQFGSGNVNLIDAAGKIAGISSTYFASLDGSALTGLTAANVTNGTFTDAQVSDTLTASLFVGAGSTTTAVDLATAEVAGVLPNANVADDLTITGGVINNTAIGAATPATGKFTTLEATDHVSVAADKKVNMEGVAGDSYMTYDSVSGRIWMYVNGKKVAWFKD